MRKLLSVALALVLLGCSKQEPTLFSGIEAGLLSGGVFTTDDGTVMKIDGNEGVYDIRTTRRVLVSYATHPVMDPSDVVIDLRGLWDATITAPIPESGLQADAADTPVLVTDAWFKGGYLNILASYPGADAALHGFAATYQVNANQIILRLRHDGSRDTAQTDATQSSFVCIPMADALEQFDLLRISLGEDLLNEVPVRFVWTWYRQDGDVLTDETVLYEKEGTYPASH